MRTLIYMCKYMCNLVHVVFGTAIPTSLNIFWKCFQYLFVHFFGILTKNVLAIVFQVLANNQWTPQFSHTQQGQGAEPLQKVTDLTKTWLTASLHCKHLTDTGSSIKRRCCPSIAWILPQVHRFSLLFDLYISAYTCFTSTADCATTLRAYSGASEGIT